MKLFNIQDSDRPMWIIATDFGDAVYRWKQKIADENDMAIEQVDEPQGCQFVCDEDELLR